jgi:hypothetical protein
MPPTVTPLPLLWRPMPNFRSGEKDSEAVLIMDAPDAAIVEQARSQRWKRIYFPDNVPDTFVQTVEAASRGATAVLRVPLDNEEKVYALMAGVSLITGNPMLASMAAEAATADGSYRPVPGLDGTRTLLHRAGFSFEAVPASGLSMSGKRVLLIADVKGWSFDVNLDVIEQILVAEGIEVDRWYAGEDGGTPPLDYDAYYLSYLCPLADKLPPHKLLGSLRTQWFRPAQPGPPNAKEWTYLRRCAGFAAVNRDAFEALIAYGADARLSYLSNPVSMMRFPKVTEVTDVIACWAGNRGHMTDPSRDAKGIHTIIEPACTTAGVKWNLAVYGKEQLRPDEMNGFYCESSVYICASAHEGASNSVLEAMACGLAVISTDTGNIREMHDAQIKHFGESGITIVERSAAAFTAALENMDESAMAHMGALNRAEIEARWSLAAWADRYLDFFARVL